MFIISWVTWLSGIPLYYYVKKKTSFSFFVSFIMLVSLWGPRCMLIGAGSRGLELRWEDIFLMLMFFEYVPGSNFITRIPKVSRRVLVFISTFMMILALNMFRLNSPSLIMYVLVYFKLLLWMITLGIFLKKNSHLLNEEEIIDNIVKICKVLVVIGIISGIYQFVSGDSAYRILASRTIGIHNWNSITGGSLKWEDRPNWFFESEPFGTGSIFLIWSVLIFYCIKKRLFLWYSLCAINIFLSFSKTTIFTFVIFTGFFIVSGGMKFKQLRVQSLIWILIMETFAVLYVVASWFRDILFGFIIAMMNGMASLVLGQDSGFAQSILRISATASISIRKDVMNLYGDTIYSSPLNTLIGSFGYTFFDNNFLFLIGVSGYVGLSVFLFSQISFYTYFKKKILQKKDTGRDLRYAIVIIYFLIIVLLGFAGEVLRQLRTLSFIFPAILIVENVIIAEENRSKKNIVGDENINE